MSQNMYRGAEYAQIHTRFVYLTGNSVNITQHGSTRITIYMHTACLD